MVYKVGTVAELDRLAISAPPPVIEAIRNELAVLDHAYGSHRNVETDDGGFVLLCEQGTKTAELKNYFDPEGRVFEWVERINSEPPFCSALYIVTNDYAVELFMAIDDVPDCIKTALLEVADD